MREPGDRSTDGPMPLRKHHPLVAGLFGFVGSLTVTGWAATPSLSPSFNCNATQLTVTEKRICGDNVLASDDKQLAYVFRTVVEKASPAERVRLLEEQKVWLEQRDKCGESWDCIDTGYHRRIFDLQFPPARYTDHVPPKSSIPPLLSGRWHASIGPNGATVKITRGAIDGTAYKILSIRPEHGVRDPMYIVTIEVGNAGGFIEAEMLQQQVLSGSVSFMFWKDCDSLSNLKKGLCSSVALSR